MLERTRNVYPKTVRSQNALIDAMEQNETIIYIVGSYAEKIKADAAGTKFIKGTSKVAKGVSTALFFLNPLAGAILFSLTSITQAATDNFKNYKIEIDDKKNRIVLTKTKGKNAYRPKLDTIVG